MGLTELPPELINNVTSQLDLGSYLALKLTCKHLAALAPNNMAAMAKVTAKIRVKDNEEFYKATGRNPDDYKPPPTMAQCILAFAHRDLELAIHRANPKRILQSVTCTQCGKLKPRSQLSDNNRHRLKPLYSTKSCRYCLKCCVTGRTRWSAYINRIRYSTCFDCHRVRPQDRMVFADPLKRWVCADGKHTEGPFYPVH